MSGDTWHGHIKVTWHPRGVPHGMNHVVHLCEWITLSQVSSRGKRRKIRKKNVGMTCGKGGKWGEVSPTFLTIWLMSIQKKRKYKMKEKRKREREENEKEKEK